MRNLTYWLFAIVLIAFTACEKSDDDADVAALEQEIAELKALLNSQTAITSVGFEGENMVLTFANGSSITTATPQSIVPAVGDNGNWWVNGEDLGVKAEADMPSIGANGNWWIGDTDTGVKAQGEQGEAGTDGADGTGIQNVEYDSETAILKLTLTDGTSYEYVLFYEEDVQGIKLGDLNGEYLLETIANGDIKVADFVYNDLNQLTDINYYTTVLNKATKNATLSRVYNAEGEIESQSLIEFATKSKAVPAGDEWDSYPDYMELDEEIIIDTESNEEIILAEVAFSELFPDGISGYEGTANDFFDSYEYCVISKENYRYRFYDREYYDEYNDVTEEWESGYRYYVRKWQVAEMHKKYMLKEINGVIYALKQGMGWFEMYDYTAFSVNEEGGVSVDYQSYKEGEIYNGRYRYGYKAIEYTTDVDEVSGSLLKDYIAISPDEIYNPDNIAGTYKILYKEYNIYEPGDEIQRATLAYEYEGANYTVSHELENLYKIVVLDDKIDGIVYYNEGVEEQILKMNYTNGKLTTVSSPVNEAIDVIKVLYDSEGNATELQVNSKQLADKGYDELFAALGLAYRTDVYDADLGMVVEKYTYPEDYTALLKVKYDYTMKNFMNHTITAANPLFSVFNSSNAIQELIWAGHGSCFFAEYGDYNEGGYPQEIKGLLQLAPFENGIESDELPINMSVATKYKLGYKKISE
ncbi:hypothetical protein [Plebeiibacterium marinum]|uniref:DUF4988 domain-containing protein n=1 Tax=Plebeiibacterium marinum TaxID=2992111 RepID=A0AAE3MDB1_9BACT|nr:hypothetical protein [Plebeiobacterium marinum]MCW3805609.1 DUF4988 domain-containing protein [Plebeiobacterium marinum]